MNVQGDLKPEVIRMGGGKKSKREGDKKSRKKAKDVQVSREPSDNEADFDEASAGPESMIPQAAKVDVEKSEAAEDEFGAKDFRSQMDLRPDHEVCIISHLKDFSLLY